MTVKLRTTGWEISGKKVHWTWGQINYWDIERSSWRDVLRAYKHADHKLLSTAILPSVHQVGPWKYDFANQKTNLDLAAFLNEVQTLGLKIICWIGPREIPGIGGAGYPIELLSDQEYLAKDSEQKKVISCLEHGQNVFCLPSLLHPKLKETLSDFKEALKPVIEPFIHPDGPVVGIGLTQAPGWSNSLTTFAADYHPDNIKSFQGYLKKRYQRISNLNKSYYTDYDKFSEVEAPVKWEGNEQKFDQKSLDWQRFKEDYFIKAAECLHEVFSDLTFDTIPLFLAALPKVSSPNNLMELEKTRCFDAVFPDVRLDQPTDLDDLKLCMNQTKYAALFNQVILADTPDDADCVHYEFLKALAAGVRGYDCLNPAGSGIYKGFITDRKGKPNSVHHRFWQLMHDHQSTEGFLDSQLHADILLLLDSEYERIKCCLISQEQDSQQQFVSDELSRSYFEVKDNLLQFMKSKQFSNLWINEEVPAGRLNKVQTILLPSHQHMSVASQQFINQVIKNGHNVIAVGTLPDAPEEAQFKGLKELVASKPKKSASKKKKTVQTGNLFHLDTFDEDKLGHLFQQLGLERPVRIDSDAVNVVYHKLRNRIFITVENPTAEPVQTVVRRDGKFVLKYFWENNKFLGGNNEINVSLPGKSITLWELITC